MLKPDLLFKLGKTTATTQKNLKGNMFLFYWSMSYGLCCEYIKRNLLLLSLGLFYFNSDTNSTYLAYQK